MPRRLYLSGLVLGFTALLGVIPFTVMAQPNSPATTEHQTSSSPRAKTVVARIWHGRTRTSKADEYYAYLKQAGIQKILAIPGNLGAQVLRRTDGDITEFTVISYWESREAIRKFAGNEIEKARYLPRDAEYLLELEPTVKHFDVLLDDRHP